MIWIKFNLFDEKKNDDSKELLTINKTLKKAFNKIKEEFEEHLGSINENTNEIQANYEYAKSLKDDDKYSALLYAEYALELSNLDIYFDNSKKTPMIYIDKSFLSVLILGILIGLLLGLLLFRRKKEQGLFIKINR